MKTIESFPKIPKQIELEFDTIRGTLHCSRCQQQLSNSGEVGMGFSKNHSQSIAHAIAYHICANAKFKYDFNSPLTIKEQYELTQSKTTA